jgi:phage tail-like protein
MTSSAALLPPVPRPPHDPLTIVLDGRVGWRIAHAPSKVEISPLDLALVLAPLPNGTRSLASADGSFGGLVPPDNVAIGPDCIVLLLDRQHLLLKHFDPCTCAFLPLPCIAGKGTEPRRLANPGGMIAACGNLYICDNGNHRVQVFSLRGLALRAIWQTPLQAQLPTPWRPVAIAADARGRIYVADLDHGWVHVFSANGRWLRALKGLGAIAHIAIDCAQRLYVQTEGSDVVEILDPDTGALLEQRTRADEVADHFAKLPFSVTPQGRLQLRACGTFDGTGSSVPNDDTVTLFEHEGTITTQALDSALRRCLWDRLQIEGDFPEGTTVSAFVYTAETELPDALIADLPDDAWAGCPALEGGSAAEKQWDAMLRAQAGRYLWLRLVLQGDGRATPRLREVRLTFPRISLRRLLPGTFGSDVLAAEFTDRFLAIFDRELRNLEHTIDYQARFYDPLSSPTSDDPRRDFLSWLASWIGVVLDRSWPLERRRRYLKHVGRLFPRRGTLQGLQQHLRLYLGVPEESDCISRQVCGPCTTDRPPRWKPPPLVLEHYRLRRWLFVGHGKLGEQARLWGESIVNRSRLGGPERHGTARLGVSQLNTTQDPLRDPFHLYAHKFSVFAPAAIARSATARRALERLIRSERPAHAAYQIVYVEPRFRIGIQSMIGFDSAIGCYPDGGVRLREARLGKATVLGGDDRPAPSLIIGREARIGTTTRLT